jgi:hypothetical protein
MRAENPTDAPVPVMQIAIFLRLFGVLALFLLGGGVNRANASKSENSL